MIKLGRSQDAYDRFCAAVEVPLLVLAVFWLPVLVIPLVARLPAGVAGTPSTCSSSPSRCCGRCGCSGCCAWSPSPGPG